MTKNNFEFKYTLILRKAEDRHFTKKITNIIYKNLRDNCY